MFSFCSLKGRTLSFSYELTRAAKPVLVIPAALQRAKCPLHTPKEDCHCAEALQRSKGSHAGHSHSWAANMTGRRKQHATEMPALGSPPLGREQEEKGAVSA